MHIKNQRNTRYLEFAEKLIEELFSVCDIYADPCDEQWREKWEDTIAQRVYDLVTPEEYIDSATRVRLTVEYDIPGHPRVTVIPPEDHHLTSEQVNEAVKKLLKSAALSQ